MRNDIKPIIPRRRKGSAIGGAYGLKESPEGRGVPGNGSGFDAERGSSVRRERGDATDPAGPKRSTTTSASGAGRRHRRQRYQRDRLAQQRPHVDDDR